MCEEMGREASWLRTLTHTCVTPPCRNGYQKFSQELLSNGELNHLPLKERMVEIGSRWQRISQSQKEHYKKLAEEQQKQYKVHLDLWVKVRESKGKGGHTRRSSLMVPRPLRNPVGQRALALLKLRKPRH